MTLVLKDQTGAATSDGVQVNSLNAGAGRVPLLRRRFDALITGTHADIQLQIEGSADGTDWGPLITGVAGDAYIGITAGVPFVRLITMGTNGPYNAYLFYSRA